MKNGSCNPATVRSIGLLALRLGVGIVFVYQGWGKLSGIEGTTGMFEGMNFPMPVFWAWLVGLVEFVGGLAVILGFFTRVAAKLLAIVMIVALLTAHLGESFASALLAISMLGSTVALVCLGGGGWVLTKKDCSCKICGCNGDMDCAKPEATK